MRQIESFCAHTMLAKISPARETLLCCDCGRTFTNKQSADEVRDYEAETGFVCPYRIDSPYEVDAE